MLKRSLLQTIRMKLPGTPLFLLLLLAVCFLAGGFISIICANQCSTETTESLSAYLHRYCGTYDPASVAFSLGHLFALYFGSVIIAFLLGFSSLGNVFIPLLSGVLGFSSFFSAACFVRAFGTKGLLAAAALFLIRLLFTLPCFFVVAGSSMNFSARLFMALFGKSGGMERIHYPQKYLLIFVLSLIWLCVGVCCERLITPQLFCEAIKEIV